MPHDDIDDAAHWRRGSEMVRTYDSASCVHELQSKEKVRAAVEMGWRRVSSACLPRPSPCTPVPAQVPAFASPGECVSLSTPPLGHTSASSSSCAMPPPGAMAQGTEDKKDGPTFVIDLTKDVLHIWQGYTRRGKPSAYTRCREYKCGTPVVQTSRFMWAAFNPSHYPQCARCFAEEVE